MLPGRNLEQRSILLLASPLHTSGFTPKQRRSAKDTATQWKTFARPFESQPFKLNMDWLHETVCNPVSTVSPAVSWITSYRSSWILCLQLLPATGAVSTFYEGLPNIRNKLFPKVIRQYLSSFSMWPGSSCQIPPIHYRNSFLHNEIKGRNKFWSL